MAFPAGYTKYQNVTIDNTKVGATLTDFPVLLTEANFVKAGADIFDTCRTDGGDIRITLTNGTTQLAREVVGIDTTAKTMEVHLNSSSLSSSVDTVIRVWYNGTDTEPAEDSTYGKENTWNSSYKIVQHMNQDPSGSAPQMVDSTSSDNDGTSGGSMTSGDLVTGEIGEALIFDGTNDNIDCGTDSSLDVGSSDFSFSIWAKCLNIGGLRMLAGKGGTFGGGKRYVFSNEASNGVIYFSLDDNSSSKTVASNGEIDDDAFHKLDGVRDGNNLRYYVDKVEVTASPVDITSYGSVDSIRPFNIASLYKESVSAQDHFFPGTIDEVRLKSGVSSADWISTEFNNQSSPGTFYSVSDEQTSGATADLTGTAITGGVTESEIVTGGDTIIITLTGDTWVATVGDDNAITDALILGITSAQSETNGWNNVVRANMVFGDVTRTSDTIVTIILAAEAAYSITANETITDTIPATALTAATEVVATPNIIVANESAGGMVKRLVDDGLLQGLTVGRLAA